VGTGTTFTVPTTLPLHFGRQKTYHAALNVLITDVVMPGMKGDELVRTIR
jgi:CheY-like chemotaxis protein